MWRSATEESHDGYVVGLRIDLTIKMMTMAVPSIHGDDSAGSCGARYEGRFDGVDGMFVARMGGLKLVDGLLEALKCGWRSNLVGILQLDLSGTPSKGMPLPL